MSMGAATAPGDPRLPTSGPSSAGTWRNTAAPAPLYSAQEMVAPGERPWRVAPRVPAGALARVPELHPILAQILYQRGWREPEAMRAFLEAEQAPLHDPRLLAGIDRAIVRLRRALQAGETIAVHGDFDVDGITACAIIAAGLEAGFQAAGSSGRIVPYLPLRSATGYGVHPSAIERLAAEGASLVVTGDTGTRALEAAQRAAELGVDLIVTDHHLPGDAVPAAVAVINPHQPHCPYPFKLLSGAGVAWKLIHALALEGLLGAFDAETLLDLVALGTIVDVSPLVGENRTLVRRGLRRLVSCPRPGIQALLAQSGSHRGVIDERTIAFSLGPRLNAAGRMDDARLALDLLTTTDPVQAAALAQQLEAQNAERRRLTEQVLIEARAQAAALGDRPVLVLRGTGWPGGVLGLVAARIADEYRRPAVVVEVGPEACRGSARSVDGFDLVGALATCADLLIEYGGHAAAAGFAVQPQRLDTVIERLLAAAAAHPFAEPAPPVADCALLETEVDWALHKALGRLGPFGAGNPPPLFASEGVRLLEARAVGASGAHLRVRCRFGKQVLTAFGPEMGRLAPRLRAAGAADLLYTLEVSSWSGDPSLELRLHDVWTGAP